MPAEERLTWVRRHLAVKGDLCAQAYSRLMEGGAPTSTPGPHNPGILFSQQPISCLPGYPGVRWAGRGLLSSFPFLCSAGGVLPC